MNEVTKRQLLTFLKAGYPLSTACARCRITSADLGRFTANDKELQLDIAEAIAQAESEVIESLKEAAFGDYKAALAFLERRNKAEWGLSQKIELEVARAKEELIDKLEAKLPAALYDEVLAYLSEDLTIEEE